MPIAKIRLPNGKIGRFNVSDGTTPEQVMEYVNQNLDKFQTQETPQQPTQAMQTSQQKQPSDNMAMIPTEGYKAPTRKQIIEQKKRSQANRDLHRFDDLKSFIYSIPVIGGGIGAVQDIKNGIGGISARLVDYVVGGNENSKQADKITRHEQDIYDASNKGGILGINPYGVNLNDVAGFATGMLGGGGAKALNVGNTAIQQGAKLLPKATGLLPKIISGAKNVGTGARDIALNATAGAITSPVLQERGQEGNQSEYAKQKAMQLGTGGAFGVGGAVLGKGISYVSKALKAKEPLDKIADKFVNDIADSLEYKSPQDLKVYKKVARNIFEDIKMQPENFDLKTINDAFERVNELKKAGFDADTNQAMDYIFNGYSNALRGKRGDFVRYKVNNVDNTQIAQGEKLLNDISNTGGVLRDKAELGKDITETIGTKRKLERQALNNKNQSLYVDAFYNKPEDAMVDKIVGTKFNKLNLSEYANKQGEIALQRPEFTSRLKYPMMSFLQGKVKRGGRFAKQLEAMDITPKSHPRLFGKNGQDSLDNVDASEFPEFTQAGYKPDDAGYISESDILDAINNELNGNPIKLNPQNMSQSEIDRLQAIEAKQREYDSYEQMYNDGVQLDQFGNEMPQVEPNVYVAENIIKTELDPKLGYKRVKDRSILRNPNVKDNIRSVQKLYPELRLETLPDAFKKNKNDYRALKNEPQTSVQNLQLVRRSLDDQISTAVDNKQNTLASDLLKTRNRINDFLQTNPSFAKADREFASLMKSFEKQDDNKFGQIIKAKGNNVSFSSIPNHIFSEKTTVRQFNEILKELERPVEGVNSVNRNDILATLIEDVKGNLGDNNIDTVYNKLFDKKYKRDKIALLTGGKDTALYKQFDTAMNALKNIKQTKSFNRGSTTANKLQDDEKASVILDNLHFVSAMSGGTTSKINYAINKISNLFKDNAEKLKMDKQGQEIMFNFFADPKNTQKNLGFIRDLKGVKSQEDAINLIQLKYPQLSNIIASQSSRMTGQAINAMSNQQDARQQSQPQKRTIDDIKRGFYEKKQNTDNDTKMQDILKRIRTPKPQASNQTGYQFKNPEFVNDTTQAESSGNPDAKSTTSTASGLAGFTDGTWGDMVKKYGKQYGLNNKADPMQQKIATDLYAEENRKYLKQKLKRNVTVKDLHVAHFMGAGGATRMILNIQRGQGDKLAYQTFRKEANANKPIFFDKNNGNRPRTIKEVYAVLASREK
jgi:hypothetical protein